MKKHFDVFYDVVVNGVCTEYYITVYNVRSRSHAINRYRELAPANAIFRSVKQLKQVY